MKRKILPFLVLPLLLLLSSCTFNMTWLENQRNHQHTYSQTWTSDGVNHWHSATCGHNEEKLSIFPHFDEGNDGVCDVCGREYYTPHSHTYSESWTSDAINHWHSATCEHTEEVIDKLPHVDNGNDGVCDVCEIEYYAIHIHTYEEKWTFDKKGHWHAATCEHTDGISDFSYHTDGNGDDICDECDYGRLRERKIDVFRTDGATNRFSIGELEYLSCEVCIEGIFVVSWSGNIIVKIDGEEIANGEKIHSNSEKKKTLICIYSQNKLSVEDFTMVFNKEILNSFATIIPTDGVPNTVSLDEKIFTDREHSFGDIPSWLVDKPYLKTGISNGADFTVTESGWVYLLTTESGNFSKAEALKAMDFETVYTFESGVVSTTLSGRILVLGKKFVAGENFEYPGAWAIIFATVDKSYEYSDPREGSMVAPNVIIYPESQLEEHPEYSMYLDGERIWQGMASIAKDNESGRLWATWYSGGNGEGEFNFVVLYTSGDGGTSWTGPVAVVDPYMKSVRAFDPNLWTDPEGRVWLIWTQSYLHNDGRFGVWAIRTENPGEASPEWTAPMRIANGVGICDPTVLENAIGDLPAGTWLLPCAVWDRENVRESVANENHPNCYVSFDKGDTWSYYGSVPATESKRNYDENMIVENSDGTLTMYIRTEAGIEKSVSRDGKNWSASVYAGITETSARFWIGKLEDGVLLAVYNAVGRSHMTAAISYDDGKSWSYKLELYEPYSIYPDVHIDEDGYIYIITCENPFDNMKINMAKIRKEDIIAGKIVTEGCYLRTVINDNTK